MGERVLIGANFNGHVGERHRGIEVLRMLDIYDVNDREKEGQMVAEFVKRMEIFVNTYETKEEQRSRGICPQLDYILGKRFNMKAETLGENLDWQQG